MTIVEFCETINSLGLSNTEKAVALLWFNDRQNQDVVMSSGQLTSIIVDHNIGAPNSTRLAIAIRKTKLVHEKKTGFHLKAGARKVIESRLPPIMNEAQPAIDHSAGYLSEPVWIRTRGYIENVCRQLNGCFQSCYYDAASVMLRRLIETLIIEAYEHLSRDSEIKDNDGNYFMLKHLVERSIGKAPHKGLKLGRDTKRGLEEVKILGDKAAHNRRFNAHRSDLVNIQHDVRTTVQELIQIAEIKRDI